MKQELTKTEKINMDIKEIAKEVRKDIKNEFGKDVKCSVRIHRFAGGCSLSVEIKKCSINLFKTEEEQQRKYPKKDIIAVKDEVKDKINEIVDFYHYDESEPMMDYFCVNFYYSGVSGHNIEVI